MAGALAKHEPALVVNAAAYTKVNLAETELKRRPGSGNEIGPGVLADNCAAAGLPLVHIFRRIMFSTCTKPGPYLETDPTRPINVYGATKAAGEVAVRGRLARHMVIRTGWVYGEFGRNFLKTIVHLARVKDELAIVADQSGSPTSTRALAQECDPANRSSLAGGGEFLGHLSFLRIGNDDLARTCKPGRCSPRLR